MKKFFFVFWYDDYTASFSIDSTFKHCVHRIQSSYVILENVKNHINTDNELDEKRTLWYQAVNQMINLTRVMNEREKLYSCFRCERLALEAAFPRFPRTTAKGFLTFQGFQLHDGKVCVCVH